MQLFKTMLSFSQQQETLLFLAKVHQEISKFYDFSFFAGLFLRESVKILIPLEKKKLIY